MKCKSYSKRVEKSDNTIFTLRAAPSVPEAASRSNCCGHTTSSSVVNIRNVIRNPQSIYNKCLKEVVVLLLPHYGIDQEVIKVPIMIEKALNLLRSHGYIIHNNCRFEEYKKELSRIILLL